MLHEIVAIHIHLATLAKVNTLCTIYSCCHAVAVMARILCSILS